MKRASLLTLALAAGLFGHGEARAADLGIARPPMPPVIEEYGSGWYLRGDIGWSGYSGVSADYITYGEPDAAFTGANLEDSWFAGAGMGYRFGWFRADVTADYRFHSQFSGTWEGNAYTGEETNWSVLVNGYVDLGTWSGITPYIGGGLGGAYHGTSGWRVNDVNLFADGSNWDFAWAVMAGFAVQVSPHALIDIGYRYVDLGKPESGFGLDDLTSTSKIRLDNVTAHELRAGVRYMID